MLWSSLRDIAVEKVQQSINVGLNDFSMIIKWGGSGVSCNLDKVFQDHGLQLGSERRVTSRLAGLGSTSRDHGTVRTKERVTH